MDLVKNIPIGDIDMVLGQCPEPLLDKILVYLGLK
jgi:hypothetical protein